MRDTPAGSVELVTPDEAAIETVKVVFEARRRGQPGEIRRNDATWPIRLGLVPEPWGEERWKGFLAVHRDPSGTPDGYVRYTGAHRWEAGVPRARITVQELVTASDAAYAALWRYLLELDLAETVVAEDRAEHERLPWLLTNARAAHPSEVGDGMWVRLFDVPRALAARATTGARSLVIEVVDEDAYGGRQRLLLDASPDGASCRPTDRLPDLVIPVAALGGAYLGGTRLRDITLVTGVDEHRPGAVAVADAVFRAVDEPVCSTFF